MDLQTRHKVDWDEAVSLDSSALRYIEKLSNTAYRISGCLIDELLQLQNCNALKAMAFTLNIEILYFIFMFFEMDDIFCNSSIVFGSIQMKDFLK